jgi:hypothetical protein
MRGLKTNRTASVVIRGNTFIQNLRRSHYELGTETPHPRLRVAQHSMNSPKQSDRASPSSSTNAAPRSNNATAPASSEDRHIARLSLIAKAASAGVLAPLDAPDTTEDFEHLRWFLYPADVGAG